MEAEVSFLRDEVREMNKNLNDLLALRNKGAGVFWLASLLFGTSILGLGTLVVSWFKP